MSSSIVLEKMAKLENIGVLGCHVDVDTVPNGRNLVGADIHIIWGQCSECGNWVSKGNYCSNCGSKLNKE